MITLSFLLITALYVVGYFTGAIRMIDILDCVFPYWLVWVVFSAVRGIVKPVAKVNEKLDSVDDIIKRVSDLKD